LVNALPIHLAPNFGGTDPFTKLQCQSLVKIPSCTPSSKFCSYVHFALLVNLS
jgi:hypothetical protein